MFKKSAVIVASVLLASCSQSPSGGGSGTTNNTVGSVIEAQFIDDPVKGLQVVSASALASKTGAMGKFSCRQGEKVSFKIAGLDLGDGVCGEKIFISDLTSDIAGYTPVKAAAIIQSLAVSSGGQLDFDQVTLDQSLVSAVSYSSLTQSALQNLQDTAATYSSPSAAPTVLDPANTSAIQALLDAAVAQYSNLSDLLKAILAEAASLPTATYDQRVAAEKVTTITGKLVSNDPHDYCYDYMQGRVSVTQESGSNKPYKLEIHRLAMFDALDAYNPATNRCSNADWCDDDTSEYVTIPAPKIIGSATVNYLMTSEIQGEYSSVSKAALTLSNQGSVSGYLVDDVSFVDDEGQSRTISCKYDLTSEAVAIPAEGPASDDHSSGGSEPEHVDLPTEATGVYNLSSDPIFCNEGTQALMANGQLPTSFRVAISGQSVTISNTDSIVETWVKQGSYRSEDTEDYTGSHYVYFNDSGTWHLDLDFNMDRSDQVGIYLYHKPSGNFDGKFCSFQLERE